MRILITGKNSFIGNSFKYFLNDKPEHQVDVISLRNEGWRNFSFKGYDVVIHLAALVHQNERKYSVNDYERVNVSFTLDIAKKALEEGVKRFIFLSTMAVFGKEKIIKKETVLNPITKYGITKLKAEQELKSILNNTRMSLCIIRPPMVYGLGAKGNPLLIQKFSNFTPFFPETFNKKSFLSIDNLMVVLFQQLFSGENITLHPQDPQYFTTFQLFSYYRSKFNKKSYQLKLLGQLFKRLSFIGYINKIFGDLYYDFFE